MTKNKSYAGIDYFRLIAALLIVAIHTSPLTSVSETGDFVLTRVIARVAVPFFFMTSGFFLITRYTCNAEKLAAFLKKTALIYGVAVVIYIPINIYNGYFRMDSLLPNIIKDIVFDGTLYHLWYLPASMLGAVIAWYMVKKLNYPKAMAAAALLYLLGLLGDSYYGITEAIPGLRGFYNLLFQITDHTRNGFFFAPVFFILGGFLAEHPEKITFRKSLVGFAVSFALMTVEALILRHFDLQRHDSMYLFLVPCMYFLFHAILYFKGKRPAGMRTVSLILYIIHPMMIVAIRLASRILHLQALLVDNSIIHYLAVSIASVVFSVVAAALLNRFKKKKPKLPKDADRSYLEINLSNLEHNVRVLNEAMPPECELMAVMKAEAYGHGMYEVAAHLDRIGVKAYATATIDEGIRLRRYGVSGEILVLGYTAPERANELAKYDLIQTLISHDHAVRLNEQGCRVKAHIKIDTGMHRLGIDYAEHEKIAEIFSLKHIEVSGIFTHLCAADSLADSDVRFTNLQIERFRTLLDTLKEKGITVPKVHIQSSYGLLNYPELKCDYVRMGVSLYGVLSSPDDRTKLQLDLKPVLALKSQIVLLRNVPKGDTVGYGRAFLAERDTLIAVLPIGYADGYPRSLSGGKGYALINGHRAPIAGRVCMDQLAVDVTDIPGVKVGMTATLIGMDGEEEISASVLADHSGSITNELLSRMGRRVKVITFETE